MKPGGQTPTTASAYQTLIAASTRAIPGEPMINVSVTVMKTAVPINLNLIPGKTTQTSALHAILNKNVVIIEEMSGRATETVHATVKTIAAHI
jgi:alpha-D-ribose 1-methylphosphonate 5-phosphate C-P lyase